MDWCTDFGLCEHRHREHVSKAQEYQPLGAGIVELWMYAKKVVRAFCSIFLQKESLSSPLVAEQWVMS